MVSTSKRRCPPLRIPAIAFSTIFRVACSRERVWLLPIRPWAHEITVVYMPAPFYLRFGYLCTFNNPELADAHQDHPLILPQRTISTEPSLCRLHTSLPLVLNPSARLEQNVNPNEVKAVRSSRRVSRAGMT